VPDTAVGRMNAKDGIWPGLGPGHLAQSLLGAAGSRPGPTAASARTDEGFFTLATAQWVSCLAYMRFELGGRVS